MRKSFKLFNQGFSLRWKSKDLGLFELTSCLTNLLVKIFSLARNNRKIIKLFYNHEFAARPTHERNKFGKLYFTIFSKFESITEK